MVFSFSSATGILSLVSLYLCFLAPGQAWWHGHGSATPRLFVRVALSTLWTTLVGLGLAAADSFHLPLIILINAVVTLMGYLYVRLPRREGLPLLPQTALGGLVIAAIAIMAYWPSYDARFAAADSTTYTVAGTHLARAHTAWKHDDVGELLSDGVRKNLFRSVFGYPNKRPYSRIDGGMVIETPDDPKVRPSFFPAAIVWSGISSDIFGVRHAGAYSAIFCGLAVWAVWIVARRRLGPLASTTVAALAAANGAAYYAAKLPLSEPIAWFFAWAALAALDAWEDDGFAADGLVAGLMLGALSLIRPEFALFTTTALCLRRLFSFSLGARPLGPGFVAGFLAMNIAALIEIRLLGGAYLAPLEEALRAIGWQVWSSRQATPLAAQIGVVTAIAVGLAAVITATRRIGFVRTAAIAIALGFVGGYCIESTPRAARSLTWLVSFLGYGAPLLALPGILVAWNRRGEVRGNSFFLVLCCLIGGLLIYNTHVSPALPWAIRRFVPIVIPATILLAGLSCDSIFRRSTIAGLLCWIAVAVTTLTPARGLWGQPYYAGASQQLHEFAQELPDDGVYLIDTRVSPLLLGIPMWLLYDLDNIPANLTTTFSRRIVDRAIYELRPHRTLYYIRPTPAAFDPLDSYDRELITDYTFQLLLPEQTIDRMPTGRESHTTTVSVYRLGARKSPS